MKIGQQGAATALLSLLWVPLAFAATSKSRVTPIEKVLEMLSGMVKKAKEDKQAEKVEWAAFKRFCSDTELQKQTAIQKADVEIEVLKATIEKHDMEVKRLEKEIGEHQDDIENDKKEEEKATKDRSGERVTYEETHADYSESIQALTQAIAALKKRDFDIPQSLLQKIRKSKHVPSASKHALENFLSMGTSVASNDVLSAPEANAYEFQSEEIVTLLKDLKDKFIGERTALEKKELQSRQAYDVVMMDLRNSIAHAENEIQKKESSKAENIAASTEAAKLLAETQASRDDDQEYLTGLIQTCQTKQKDFATRQGLRDEEVAAIEEAIEIISGEAVSGTAEKHLPQMLQVRSGTSLLQFLSPLEGPANQKKAIAFLTAEGQRLDSHVLSALAVTMSDNPFKKVIKMLEDLISRLEEQAQEEKDHHDWCEAELKTNEKTRKEKTEEVNDLTASIDKLESRLAVLKKDLATLSKEIAEINAAIAEATKIREKEKQTNEATIAEAVEGQTAIAQATKILKDYYKKAGANTALVQRDSQEPPIFDSAFKGQQKANNNVMAFLEVIASDFARLETDTKKAEQTAQNDYEDEMAENEKSRDAKEKEQKEKEKEQLAKSEELSTKRDDLESAQKELDAAMDYFDKLKPSCVNPGTTYEDRVQRREEEIQALKEAYDILNGEGVPTGPDALYSSTQGGNLAVEYR